MQKHKQNFISRTLNRACLCRRACNHLVGENHSKTHRISFGIVVGFVGVCIAKASHLVHFMPIHILLDGIGYFLHAAGAVPLLTLIEGYKNIDEETE